MLTNCFIYKSKSVKEATCAAVLKALRTRRKPANPNHIIFLSEYKFFKSRTKDKQPEQQISLVLP
jgi:hypothetical protein